MALNQRQDIERAHYKRQRQEILRIFVGLTHDERESPVYSEIHDQEINVAKILFGWPEARIQSYVDKARIGSLDFTGYSQILKRERYLLQFLPWIRRPGFDTFPEVESFESYLARVCAFGRLLPPSRPVDAEALKRAYGNWRPTRPYRTNPGRTGGIKEYSISTARVRAREGRPIVERVDQRLQSRKEFLEGNEKWRTLAKNYQNMSSQELEEMWRFKL